MCQSLIRLIVARFRDRHITTPELCWVRCATCWIGGHVLRVLRSFGVMVRTSIDDDDVIVIIIIEQGGGMRAGNRPYSKDISYCEYEIKRVQNGQLQAAHSARNITKLPWHHTPAFLGCSVLL